MTEDKGAHCYYPEMGHEKPTCQIEAKFSYDRWRLKTPLELKGRGIKHVDTMTADRGWSVAAHRTGWFVYEVTQLAFQKLKKDYSIGVEILLD